MLNVGSAPLSWGVFEGEARTNPPWRLVLDEIVQAGYDRTELGPIGFLPEDTALLRDELSQRGLSLTAGFVYEHLHDPDQREHVLNTTRRVGRVLSELGSSYLVVMDRMVPERQQTAGRSEVAERLDPEDWSGMIEMIATVSELAAEEFGLRPVLHPHSGGYIEFSDEVDHALADLPHSTIGLCIDTGHVAVAGMRAADLVDQYADRVEYFHFKDVDPAALQRMRDEGLGFEEALAVGLFCPIGQGLVDFTALRDSLQRVGYDGAASVEQDPDPKAADYSGLAAARASITFLRQTGLALVPSHAAEGQRVERRSQ